MLYGFTDLMGVRSGEKTLITGLVNGNTSKTSDSRATLTIQAIYPNSLMLHLIALNTVALNTVALNLVALYFVALMLVLALELEPILQNARTGLH